MIFVVYYAISMMFGAGYSAPFLLCHSCYMRSVVKPYQININKAILYLMLFTIGRLGFKNEDTGQN